MKIFKTVMIFLLVAFVVIQFFPPDGNVQDAPSPNDMVAHFSVPNDVQNILYKACYDCHSNNTTYPWYANIQPVAWWLADHIKEGKKELNFSEYSTFSLRRQYHKLEEIVDQVKEGEMPLESYTVIHRDADLTQQEKEVLINWASATMAGMKERYPIDSLIAPRK